MFSLPEMPVDLPKFPSVRDAAYMTVGLGVVAAEKIQVRGQQLSNVITEQVTARVAQVRELIRTAV